MKFAEKEAIVQAAGFNVADTEDWFRKYRNHLDMSTYRGLSSQLSFEQYLVKVREGGLNEPSEIGRQKGQFVLGREGDVGNYTNDNCRFIPVEQNHRERFENGMHVEGNKRRSEVMTGQTMETSERLQKVSAALKGRTKETHAGYQAVSEAKAKDFVLISPDGVIYTSTNVREFCEANDLHVFSIYNVFAGRKNHYKGWTGHYVDSNKK